MADRQRQTNRFNFRGLNTRLLADAVPLGHHPAAINVRADGDSKIRTRPGYTIVADSGSGGTFSTGGIAITDISSYTTLGTDNAPRIVVHDSGGGVWLDDGKKKGTAGTGGIGASLIPYRPNQSPQSWMYVCNGTGYRKFSAPTTDSIQTVTDYKVGIAEPQSPPDACPDGRQYTDFTSSHASWTNGGTAGGTSDVTRSTDTVVAIFADPASVSPATKTRYSAQIGSNKSYQVDEILSFNKSSGGTVSAVVEDVYPPVNAGTALTIQDILYLNGPNGQCIIVPSQLAVGTAVPPFSASGDPTAQLPALATQLASLRRGSLIQLNAEVVFVLSVTVGPQHQIAIECSTTGTHVAGETIVGIPAICVSGISSLVVGQTVTSAQINSTIAKGVGTLTQTLGTNPFNQPLGSVGTPQEDDLVHFSLTADLPQNITEVKILFDISDGSFTKDILYFAVSQSIVEGAVNNNLTQAAVTQQIGTNAVIQQALVNAGVSQPLIDTARQFNYDPRTGKATVVVGGARGAQIITLFLPVESGVGQYGEVSVSIGSLLRSGNDQTKSLVNCVAVQILANVTAATVIGFGSLWVGGGGQPDVGANGSPYFYRVRPRSSVTGAPGNPSPAMRYGVLPRSQPVILPLPSAAYDPQIDTWDIFRYGGSVTSWRRVGAASSSATTFTDNALDSAALQGEELLFDNFEPWPSVDVPWNITAGVGGITSITIYGTAIVIMGSSFPSTITRWLPGTFITLDGQYVYTLWNRPVSITGGYLLRIIENASAPTVTSLSVQEPNVANQNLPYLWGPDANGVIFGAGDPLRPGVLYSTKQFSPDTTPNNVYDAVPPSEPTMGGEIIDGLGLLATSKRWFEIQQAFGTPRRWNLVETPAGRGLAAPYGHCTDGKAVYFWAKDSICSMVPGLPAVPLTDVDLKNLFPTGDGTPGTDVTYAGYTFYAPDYARASQFRLSIINSKLRAHYRDTTGTARTLVLDLSLDGEGKPRMAWTSDHYAAPITNSYQPPQPPGTLLTTGRGFHQGYLVDSSGFLYTESDLTNDNGTPIACAVAPPEWDAQDARYQKQWLDLWLDAIPAAVAGILITPVSGGAAVGTPISLAQSASRILPPSILPLGSPVSNFLSPVLSWTDDFRTQSVPTTLIEWSLEFVPQPVLIRSWQSIPTSHGLQGYHHIRKVVFAYLTKGANDVTLTISAYDGTSPTAITLPATNGAYQKVEFVPTFNKGLLFTYVGSSSDQWAPVLEDCEVWVGQWARNGPYSVFVELGGRES